MRSVQTIFLILLTLPTLSLTAKVYYNNSTIYWPGETVKSYTLDTSGGKYNELTDYGPGLVNVKTFTDYGGWPGAKTEWGNDSPFQIAENNCSKLQISISYNMNWNGRWSQSGQFIAVLFGYNDSVGSRTIQIILSVSWWLTGYSDVTFNGFNSSDTITFTTLSSQNNSDFWFTPAPQVPNRTNYFAQFDMFEILRFLKTRGAVGAVSFNYIVPRLETNHFHADANLSVSKSLYQTSPGMPSTLVLSGLYVFSEVYQNVTLPNYSQFIMKNSVLNGSVSDFNFPNSYLFVKAYQFVAFGYRNKSWVTPKNQFLFPIQIVSKLVNMNTTFSYVQYDSITPTYKTGCITIVVRNDYKNGSFNTSKTTPFAEVFVCPFWNLPRPGPSKRMFRFTDTMFFNTYVTQGQWPTVTFISITSFTSVDNWNLFLFIQQAMLEIPDLNNKYISSIQMGFRFYSGKGAFELKQSSINNQVLPSSSLAVDSAQCLIENIGANSTHNDLCPTGTVIYETVKQIMSSPNVALLIRMVCALRLIDDLTYYVYHKDSYDERFRGLALIAWNLTSSKWMIPQLAPIYASFQLTYNPSITQDPTYSVPFSYCQLEEDANFLRQTEDYWLGSFPLTIIIFFVLHLIYVLFDRYRVTRKISKLLFRFSWFGFLSVSLVGDNLQYLSFRCFSQIYQLLPLGPSQLASIVMSYITLFFVVFYSASAYYILPVFLMKKSKLLIEGYHRQFRTASYLNCLCMIRVVSGMIHSTLYQDSLTQITMLFAIQSILLGLLLYCRTLYLHKSLFTCHLMEAIFRAVLHVVLIIEVARKEIMRSGPKSLSNFSGALVEYILVCSLVDILLSNTLGGDVLDALHSTFIHRMHRKNNRNKIHFDKDTDAKTEYDKGQMMFFKPKSQKVSREATARKDVRAQVIKRKMAIKKKNKTRHKILKVSFGSNHLLKLQSDILHGNAEQTTFSRVV